MNLDPPHPLNQTLLAHRGHRSDAPLIAPPDSHPDPYYGLGSHPDCVARVWEELGGALPVDCRAFVHGTPGLVEPTSGVVLALTCGTSYLLRVPTARLAQAVSAGCELVHRWGNGTLTDAATEYGEGWLFGGWARAEAQWLREVYDEVRGAP